jgi:hypothetical protein
MAKKSTTFKGEVKPYGASGHFNEPRRHSLQARGIKTGNLSSPIPVQKTTLKKSMKILTNNNWNVNMLSKSLKNIADVKDVTINYLNKEKNSVKLIIKTSSGVEIVLWGMPNDTFFYEDLKVKGKVPQKDIDELNRIGSELAKLGIRNIPNIKSLDHSTFVTTGKVFGDVVEYTYSGSLNYMPAKRGLKSGWTGNMEFYTDEDYDNKVQLDMTKSVIKRLKMDGFDLDGAKTDEEYYKVIDELQYAMIDNKGYMKMLQGIAKQDFGVK